MYYNPFIAHVVIARVCLSLLSFQVEKENDPELDQLLTDLNVLESYVSHFLDEQQGGVSAPHPPTVDGQAVR